MLLIIDILAGCTAGASFGTPRALIISRVLNRSGQKHSPKTRFTALGKGNEPRVYRRILAVLGFCMVSASYANAQRVSVGGGLAGRSLRRCASRLRLRLLRLCSVRPRALRRPWTKLLLRRRLHRRRALVPWRLRRPRLLRRTPWLRRSPWFQRPSRLRRSRTCLCWTRRSWRRSPRLVPRRLRNAAEVTHAVASQLVEAPHVAASQHVEALSRRRTQVACILNLTRGSKGRAAHAAGLFVFIAATLKQHRLEAGIPQLKAETNGKWSLTSGRVTGGFVWRDTHLHPDVRLASPMEEFTGFPRTASSTRFLGSPGSRFFAGPVLPEGLFGEHQAGLFTKGCGPDSFAATSSSSFATVFFNQPRTAAWSL